MGNQAKKRNFLALLAIPLLSISLIGGEMSNSDIAEASQNPITMIYSLPIQNNTYLGLGDTNDVKNIANFQPVIPMDITQDWDIVWRLVMPVVTVPGIPSAFNQKEKSRHSAMVQQGLVIRLYLLFWHQKRAESLSGVRERFSMHQPHRMIY
jgi:hypothetical protein